METAIGFKAQKVEWARGSGLTSTMNRGSGCHYQQPRREAVLMIDLRIAKKYFEYDKVAGQLFWRTSPNPARIPKGQKAGSVRKSRTSAGYRHAEVRFRGSAYPSHRIIWLLVHGKWPNGEIDHINGDSLDNRIENLRDVSRSENMRNRALHSKNKSGCFGVSFASNANRWVAKIRHQGKIISLGNHETIFDAACARKSAELRFGYHENHGRKMS
jgi:hypothetical protein